MTRSLQPNLSSSFLHLLPPLSSPSGYLPTDILPPLSPSFIPSSSPYHYLHIPHFSGPFFRARVSERKYILLPHTTDSISRGGKRRGAEGRFTTSSPRFQSPSEALYPPAFSDERAKSLSSSAPPPFSPFLPPGPNASSLAFSFPPPPLFILQ